MGSNVSADLYMKRGIMQLSRERRTNFNRSFDPCYDDIQRSRQDRIEVRSWQMNWPENMANGLVQRHWCYEKKIFHPNVPAL